MFDLSHVLAAAEIIRLAAGLPGDARFILQQTIEQCGARPFVHVAGALDVKGDLRLDWENPPWDTDRFCGLVVEGDLKVAGSLTNFDMGGGPTLLVLGDVKADRIVQGGASWLLGRNVTVTRSFFGVYNDGYVFVGGDLRAAAVINYDHAFTVVGQTAGVAIDSRNGHAYVVDELFDEEFGLDWDELVIRARRDEPLTRSTPRATSIVVAASDANPALLAAALASGAPLESTDEFGNTPLLLALMDGRWENVRLLLDEGASLAAVNERRESVAHLLAHVTDEAKLRLVLSKSPKLDGTDGEERTPIMRAIEHSNLEYLRLLLDRGVALPAPRKRDGYPYSLGLAEKGQTAMLEFLVAAGADVSWRDEDDWTKEGYPLLHEAAWKGNDTSVRTLLRAGLSPDVREAKGRTPLRVMLDLASRVHEDAPDVPLAVATLLLGAGADPLVKANDGRDSLDVAMTSPDKRLLRAVFDAAVANGQLDAQRRAAAEARLAEP